MTLERTESLGSFLAATGKVIDLKATTVEAALAEFVDYFHRCQFVSDYDEVFEGALAHEAIASTCFPGTGLAIPHVRSRRVTCEAVVLGRSPRGIPWGDSGDGPVHVVIFDAVRPDAGTAWHLHLQGAISRAFSNDPNLTKAVLEGSPQDALELLGGPPAKKPWWKLW